MINEIIDAVVLWVDGNDPTHQQKRQFFMEKPQENEMPYGTLDWRFLDTGEIKYCLFSLRKFAPWIRNIFLVTDNQKPSWLNSAIQDKLGIKIIDHKDIFRGFHEYLPSFNSISITSLVWKIPNLSENYIFLNDDIFLIKPVKSNDFFLDGKIVIRGKFVPRQNSFVKIFKRFLKRYFFTKKGIKIIEKSNPYNNGAKLVGFKKRIFITLHCPLAFNIIEQKNYYESNPDRLKSNISYRFRNNEQFLASVLHNHILIKKNLAIIHDGSDAEMIIPGYGGLKGLKGQREKFDALKRGNHGKKFLCFQDLAFLKQENPEEFQEVIDWLEETIMR